MVKVLVCGAATLLCLPLLAGQGHSAAAGGAASLEGKQLN
jgi:hypothetical protein